MISKAFAFHVPSEASKKAITELRRSFSELEQLIQVYAPNSRQRSVALTNLETAAMWAIKSVVSTDPESIAVTED